MHGGPPQQQYCRCSRENRRIHVDGFMIHLIWAKEAHYIYFFLFPLLHSFHACGILRSQSHVFSIIWNCGHVFLFFFFSSLRCGSARLCYICSSPCQTVVQMMTCACSLSVHVVYQDKNKAGFTASFKWHDSLIFVDHKFRCHDIIKKKKTAWNLRSPMLGVHTKDNTIWPKKKK